MKKQNNNSIKENDFSLDNLDNYYKIFNHSVSEILHKYTYLINEFFKFILEKTKFKNNSYIKFIITRGYETITHIFNITLYYTKNLDLTFYHCQKSFYYYVEFVEQISHEQHSFLQLTSRDATTYVYKKTLSELKNELKKNMAPSSNEVKKIIEIIDEQIKLFKLTFEFIIENIHLDKPLNNNIKILDKYQDFCKKIINSKLEIENIKIFYKIVENINRNFQYNYNTSYKTPDENILDKYIEFVLIIIKKCTKKGSNIEFWKIIEHQSYNNELYN